MKSFLYRNYLESYKVKKQNKTIRKTEVLWIIFLFVFKKKTDRISEFLYM